MRNFYFYKSTNFGDKDPDMTDFFHLHDDELINPEWRVICPKSWHKFGDFASIPCWRDLPLFFCIFNHTFKGLYIGSGNMEDCYQFCVSCIYTGSLNKFDDMAHQCIYYLILQALNTFCTKSVYFVFLFLLNYFYN